MIMPYFETFPEMHQWFRDNNPETIELDDPTWERCKNMFESEPNSLWPNFKGIWMTKIKNNERIL